MKRTLYTILTLVAGIILAVLGFFLSAPIGAPVGPEISEPKLPMAPVLFILGVMLVFLSAVVYELCKD